MNFKFLTEFFSGLSQSLSMAMENPFTYIQILLIFSVYLLSYIVASKIRSNISLIKNKPEDTSHPLRKLVFRIGSVLYPLFAILVLHFSNQLSANFGYDTWLINFALSVAMLLFYYSLIGVFVTNIVIATLLKWIGLPLLFLHLTGALAPIIVVLESIAIDIGNISVSAYGILRVTIFGSLLFWIGRESSNFGNEVIYKQESLDIRTREVVSKLYQVGLFCLVCILLLNIMGVNLTALTVFGGALGVGLGFGLQSIASNFISGIIILLDRSITVGDFIELENGKMGAVRKFSMRFTILETYDGKDIVVPNEQFITSQFINWTHKDPKQRYRVDFSVPYATDVRSMVEFIKVAVAEHPQVVSGDEVPIEERPDCEIDSFGDSGINMFVEFWIEGVDDGKNRVGGDLMLTILETLKENGIEIPFPQREIRILSEEDAPLQGK